jgi:hypothetical protein
MAGFRDFALRIRLGQRVEWTMRVPVTTELVAVCEEVHNPLRISLSDFPRTETRRAHTGVFEFI